MSRVPALRSAGFLGIGFGVFLGMLAGCRSLQEVPILWMESDVSEPVYLTLDRVQTPPLGIVDGSRSVDGRLWLLDGLSQDLLVWDPTTVSGQRMALMDEQGNLLLDPVTVDASAGLSLIVGDRALGRIYRYDRQGTLLDAWSVPEPGPGETRRMLAPGNVASAMGFSRVAMVTGGVVALLDPATSRVAVVDETAREARFLDIPGSAGAMAAWRGTLLVVDAAASRLHLLDPSGASFREIRLPASGEDERVVDMQIHDGQIFLLGSAGQVWLMDGLLPGQGATRPRLRRFRSGSTASTWTGLLVGDAHLWWMSEDGLYRSARPR